MADDAKNEELSTYLDDEADEFDPLAPIEFEDDEDDDKGEEQSYYVDKIPDIAPSIEEAAAARRAKYPVPELTTAEKIAKAIKGMPGQRKLLLHVIDFCRQEREDTEVIDEIRSFERGGVNVYAPESIIAILTRCGALRQTNAPAEGEDDDAAEPAEAPEAQDAENPATADDGEGLAEVGQAAGDAPTGVRAADGATGIADAAPAPDGDADADVDVAEDGETLQVSVPEPARYLATEEGLAAAEAENPAARFLAFMDANAIYAPVFRTVLEACADDGGATKKQIDALVDHDPVCREPRRFSGYFVDKLEEADGIVFEGTWHITDAGRAMLEEDGVIGALC